MEPPSQPLLSAAYKLLRACGKEDSPAAEGLLRPRIVLLDVGETCSSASPHELQPMPGGSGNFRMRPGQSSTDTSVIQCGVCEGSDTNTGQMGVSCAFAFSIFFQDVRGRSVVRYLRVGYSRVVYISVNIRTPLCATSQMTPTSFQKANMPES